MLIGTLRIEFRLHAVFSKKEKRSIANKLKEKLRYKFNVSVAEIEELESLQSLVLAVITVSNDNRHVQSTLSKVLNQIEAVSTEEILHVSTEIFGAKPAGPGR